MLGLLILGMFIGGVSAGVAMVTGYSALGGLAVYSGIGSLSSLIFAAVAFTRAGLQRTPAEKCDARVKAST